MKKFAVIVTRWLKASLHLFMVSFVLVLPLGYYPNSTDSSEFSVGVHGGVGQVASVLRDCNGDALHTEKSTYQDVSGLASWKLNSGGNLIIVIGARGGYWEVSKARFAQTIFDSTGGSVYGSTPAVNLHSKYLNPHFSIEERNIGLGIGIMIGNVPQDFDNINDDPLDLYNFNDARIPFSAHLRIGNCQKVHFITSFAENTPIISGGGLFNLGLGYPIGENVRMYSGLSAGFYDRGGFLQQGRFRLLRGLDADISVRIGGAGNAFEGSFSGGVIYRIGGR